MKKIKVLQKYAEEYLGMTASVKLDEHHSRFHIKGHQETNIGISPLGTRYSECSNPIKDHVDLIQDCMLHSCNKCCLGDANKEGVKLRSCRFNYCTVATSNNGDTTGKEC